MKDQDHPPNSDPQRQALIEMLQQFADDPDLAGEDDQVKTLVAKIYKGARRQRRKESAQQIKAEDQLRKANTALFRINDEFEAGKELPTDPASMELVGSQRCYCCKQLYHQLHFFYHQLCPECAEFNYAQRSLICDLSGHRALLTGGRIKIGMEIALMLLRCGAELHLTTRFPTNAQQRFSEQVDYDVWKDRLFIHGLDLRNIPAVMQFVEDLKRDLPSLDIIINNAAQTIKRPAEFYRELIAGEQQNFLLESGTANLPVTGSPDFPIGLYDNHQQQVDLRKDNSWVGKLEDVDVTEMLETQLVNVTSPFLLNGGLKPLMLKSSNPMKFIVNVSAMEGSFSRENKTVFHPHTNMAKAALNMMTRTSAADYAKDNIFMTSVDTGWITDENPAPKRQRMRDKGFIPPLDIIDGAARVFAPIAQGINSPEDVQYGVFLKDYHVVDW